MTRREPLIDRLLEFFRDQRYRTYNMVDLFQLFPDDSYSKIRQAMEELIRRRQVRFTGEIRPAAMVGSDKSRDYITIYLVLYQR